MSEEGVELVLCDSGSQAPGTQEPREKQRGHRMGPPLSHDAKGDIKKKKDNYYPLS